MFYRNGLNFAVLEGSSIKIKWLPMYLKFPAGVQTVDWQNLHDTKKPGLKCREFVLVMDLLEMYLEALGLRSGAHSMEKQMVSFTIY